MRAGGGEGVLKQTHIATLTAALERRTRDLFLGVWGVGLNKARVFKKSKNFHKVTVAQTRMIETFDRYKKSKLLTSTFDRYKKKREKERTREKTRDS